ncbi:MAG TPA: exonuclease SbcCD subunit D [Lamprocystis sp. (in: g-proteobacteria)]|nr:exonuclease SbcCD subunit D [Lamprocystis sp. (in: g-proteobacteria)]
MAFRFIHTADWHLGRLFHTVPLLEDQAHLLAQLLDLIRDVRPDAVIVAGDVYDRAVPPADAVRLLDETVATIVAGLGVPLIMIAGNHDSPDRLGFGSKLLAAQGFHVRGPFPATLAPIRLDHADGPVYVYPIPYAEPALVRERLGDPQAHSHDAAMAVALAAMAAAGSLPARSIAVAHCFVTGGAESESERPLCVGGAGNVDAVRFAGFDFVALGHLHRPQALGANCHYAGSLLKYSFAEAAHVKSVNLVEMDATGACRVERIALRPRRDLRIIEGRLADLLTGPTTGDSADDYLLVRLLDKEALLDPMGKLRAVYPNVLHLERPGLLATGTRASSGQERLRRTEQALFASFFEQMTGDALAADQGAAFAGVLDDLRQVERESVP